VRRWHRQVHHEKRVARSLAPLESAGWTVLHDRTVAAHRVYHVLVGPPGVVLVYDYLAGSLWRYRARRLGALTHSVVACCWPCRWWRCTDEGSPVLALPPR